VTSVVKQGAECYNIFDISSWDHKDIELSSPRTNLPVAINTAKEVLAWVATLTPRPTAVLYDPFATIGIIVAKTLNVPLICSMSYSPHSKSAVPTFWGSAADIETIKQEYDVDLSHNSWLHPNLPQSNNKAFNISYTVPLLAQNQLPEEIVRSINFAGAVLVERALEDQKSPILDQIKEQKARGKKIFFVSLGTVVGKFYYLPQVKAFMTRFFDLVADAVAEREDIEAYVTFIAGTNQWLTDRTAPLPPNFHACDYLPQLEVLPLCDVFLSHCGANSFNEALYLGIPLLGLPFVGDQVGNAAYIDKLEVGTCFSYDEGYNVVSGLNLNPERKSLTKENLLAALDKALKEETKTKSKEISTLYAQYSIEHVVDKLIEWVKEETKA